jgi:hypothetical protein
MAYELGNIGSYMAKRKANMEAYKKTHAGQRLEKRKSQSKGRTGKNMSEARRSAAMTASKNRRKAAMNATRRFPPVRTMVRNIVARAVERENARLAAPTIAELSRNNYALAHTIFANNPLTRAQLRELAWQRRLAGNARYGGRKIPNTRL